jgi:transketolase
MSDWKDDVKALRKDIFLAAYAGGMGHLASSFSCVEILYALYCGGVMRHDPRDPSLAGRDRLILSKGHAGLALYAVLCKAGYFDKEQLMRFTRPGSLLGGEPSLCLPFGIEASTGSLGHGLPLGVGMALAQKADCADGRIFVLLGDGESEEGSVWEAVMTAARYGLDNLVILLDRNGLQKMDSVQNVLNIASWKERFEAFGLSCIEADGHDVPALEQALRAPASAGKPRVVIARTVKGKGVSLMENNPAWHWRMPNKRELKVFMRELDITAEELASCR